MKEIILLEQFILNSPATNKEHQEALHWLKVLASKVEEKSEEITVS